MTHVLFQAPAIPVQVYSKYGQHKSFLEIVQQGDRVRVQPTQQGHQSLNRFWFMWLRQMILQKADTRYSFAVEIFRKNVVVSSTASQEGLRATVASIAAEIRPLRELPLERYEERGVTYSPRGPLRWVVKKKGLPIATLIATCKLPHGVKLVYETSTPVHRADSGGQVVLTSRSRGLSLSELGMLVELHFALACAS